MMECDKCPIREECDVIKSEFALRKASYIDTSDMRLKVDREKYEAYRKARFCPLLELLSDKFVVRL